MGDLKERGAILCGIMPLLLFCIGLRYGSVSFPIEPHLAAIEYNKVRNFAQGKERMGESPGLRYNGCCKDICSVSFNFAMISRCDMPEDFFPFIPLRRCSRLVRLSLRL